MLDGVVELLCERLDKTQDFGRGLVRVESMGDPRGYGACKREFSDMPRCGGLRGATLACAFGPHSTSVVERLEGGSENGLRTVFTLVVGAQILVYATSL